MGKSKIACAVIQAKLIPYSWYVHAPPGSPPLLACIGPAGRDDRANGWYEMEQYELSSVRMEDGPLGFVPHAMQFQIYAFKKKYNLPADFHVYSQIPYSPP